MIEKYTEEIIELYPKLNLKVHKVTKRGPEWRMEKIKAEKEKRQKLEEELKEAAKEDKRQMLIDRSNEHLSR